MPSQAEADVRAVVKAAVGTEAVSVVVDGRFVAVVAFELVGSADGVVELGDAADDLGVLVEVGVALVLVLLELADLAFEVFDPLVAPGRDRAPVLMPVAAGPLEVLAGGVEPAAGPPPGPPSQPLAGGSLFG